MRILFVYPGYIVREVPLNIMYISAVAKKEGHECELFHFAPYKSKSFIKTTSELIVEAFEKKLKEYDPDVVAITVMIQDYDLTRKITSIAKKKYGKVTIWGGIQPILEPLKCFEEEALDYICAGEGEVVFPKLLKAIETKGNIKDLEGIWFKENGKVVENGRPYLISDLDGLPFPDRDLLEDKYYKAELTGANILTARGCPFPCSFCQNKELMNIYRGKGNFVRYRSLENIFKEIEFIIEKYNAPSFYISDEMFTLDKKRAGEFCKEYKHRIQKPFMIQTRIDSIDDEDLVRDLKDAGCFMINLAIESGNDHLRNVILRKNTPRDQILRVFKLLEKNGIMTTSFNMIGVPGETKRTIHETIDINKEVGAARILCTIFMPLPGTELGNYCDKNNLLKRRLEDTTNYYSQVTVKNQELSDRTLIGYQGFFDWYVLLSSKWHPFINFFRYVYQICVTPDLPKSQFFFKVRENIVEFVYQLKRFLPHKRIHIKNR